LVLQNKLRFYLSNTIKIWEIKFEIENNYRDWGTNNGKEIDTCEGSHRAFEAHATSTNAKISPSLINLEVSRRGFVSEATHVDVGSTCISIFVSLSFPPLILYANSLQNSNVSCFFYFYVKFGPYFFLLLFVLFLILFLIEFFSSISFMDFIIFYSLLLWGNISLLIQVTDLKG